MSSKNDKIGALVCALPGMKSEHVGLISDIAHRLNHQNPATARAWQKHLAHVLQCGLPEHMTGVLQQLNVANLRSHPEKRLIASLDDDFCRDIDDVFKSERFAHDTPNTEGESIQIFRLKKSATAMGVFDVFGLPLGVLCLSQDQIVRFVRDHSRELARNGDATLALVYAKEPEEIVVVSIGLDPDCLLEIGMCSLSDTHRYDVRNNSGQHRVLVPRNVIDRRT